MDNLIPKINPILDILSGHITIHYPLLVILKFWRIFYIYTGEFLKMLIVGIFFGQNLLKTCHKKFGPKRLSRFDAY